MSLGVTNSTNMELLASSLFYGTAAAYATRKFSIAGMYKAGAKAAELIGSKHVEANWNKIGDEYLAKAKKNVVRDLSEITGFIVAMSLVCRIGDSIKAEAKALDADDSYFTLSNLAKTAVAGYAVFNAYMNFPYSRDYQGDGDRNLDLYRCFGASRFYYKNGGYEED